MEEVVICVITCPFVIDQSTVIDQIADAVAILHDCLQIQFDILKIEARLEQQDLVTEASRSRALIKENKFWKDLESLEAQIKAIQDEMNIIKGQQN